MVAKVKMLEKYENSYVKIIKKTSIMIHFWEKFIKDMFSMFISFSE